MKPKKQPARSARPIGDLSTAEVAAAFHRRFAALGSRERAAGEKSYLKSALRFHGVTVPQVRQAAADFCRRHPTLPPAGLRDLARALFASAFHDVRSLAIALLERRNDLLAARDLPWLITCVRSTANWAHVDWLATKVIGPLVAALPAARRRALLTRWARDEDLWVRRTALLSQHDALRAGGGDFPLFAALAATLLEEREFFIRKAIGWILRTVAARRPELTFSFLERHRPRVSGLTWREGVRRLPPDLREALGAPAAGPRATRPARRPARRRRTRASPAPRPASARATRGR
jgi:3-methyladenine DNA glycosylase AlkD